MNQFGPCDWKGDPLPDDEPDEKEVLAWHIEPPDAEYDYYLERDYYHAREIAERCLELAMDQADEIAPDERESTVFRVSLERVTVGQLRKIGAMPSMPTSN